MSINRVIVTGNLTRDIEVRSTASGVAVGGFGIAVNDRRKNKQGEWEDYPNYFDCTLFGSRAESLSRYLVKGTKVAIEGKLRLSQWTAKDGSKRSKVEIAVDDIELMSRSDWGGRSYGSGRPSGSQQVVDAGTSLYDEDIPF